MRVEATARSTVPFPETERVQAQASQGVTEVEKPARPSPIAPEEPDRESIQEAVTKMNRAARALNRALEFEVVDKNRVVIRVIDAESREVIREIPPERLMEALRSVEETIGLLLDRKV